MAILLPRRWQQQPQSSLQIDWSNPITKGLVWCSAPAINSNSELVSNKPLLFPNAPSETPTVFQNSFSGRTFAHGQSLPNNTLPITSAFTMAVVGQLNQQLPANVASFVQFYPGWVNTELRLYNNNANGFNVAGFALNGSGGAINAATTLTTTSMFGRKFIAISTPETNNQPLDIYINGVFNRLSSSGLWTGTTTQIFNEQAFYARTDYPQYFTQIALFWNRRLANVEQVSMSGNPWQLFRPQTRILYSIPSAPANLVAGRLLKRRYQTQPAGDVQVNWAHPLARGLIYAQVPGSARRGFFRLSDPQITSANFGTGLSNSIFAYSTAAGTNGLGIKGRSAMTDTAGTTSGTLNLRSSAAGGNPVYTYAGVFERSVLDTTQQSIATFAINGGQALTTITQNSGGSVSTFSTRFVDGSANTEIYNATVTNLITDKKLNVVFSVYENGQEPIGIVNNTQLVLDNNVNFDGISTSFSANYLNATGTYVGLATFFWTRILSASEIASFTQNPWQLFIPAKPVYFAVTSITYSYSRPNADSSPLQWNRFPAGGTHFSAIDEVTSDPSDYLYAPSLGLVDTMTCSAVNQPIAGSNILVNYTTGSTPPSQIKIELLEGSTAIKSSTVSAASGTITIIPAEWAVVSSWPWTPTLRITSQ